MGKEQELRPEALEAARAEFFSPNQLQSTKLERAIAAYLSAASDEQAEVVACPDCGGNGHIAIDVSHPECCGQFGKSGECCGNAVEGRHQEAMPCQRCLGLGWFTASPPAVAAGGVTATWHPLDAEGYAELRVNGARITTFASYPAAEEAADRINKALAVGDEGIREGWQPVTDDVRGPVTVCRFGDADHGWLPMTAYRVSGGKWERPASRDGLPYDPTHWQPLPTPPSRGEEGE